MRVRRWSSFLSRRTGALLAFKVGVVSHFLNSDAANFRNLYVGGLTFASVNDIILRTHAALPGQLVIISARAAKLHSAELSPSRSSNSFNILAALVHKNDREEQHGSLVLY